MLSVLGVVVTIVGVFIWCISSQVCIVAVLSVQFQMNPVCVVCVVTSD